jgi:hypothetical protein
VSDTEGFIMVRSIPAPKECAHVGKLNVGGLWRCVTCGATGAPPEPEECDCCCPKCDRPWHEHHGDGHDEPICPAPPEPEVVLEYAISPRIRQRLTRRNGRFSVETKFTDDGEWASFGVTDDGEWAGFGVSDVPLIRALVAALTEARAEVGAFRILVDAKDTLLTESRAREARLEQELRELKAEQEQCHAYGERDAAERDRLREALEAMPHAHLDCAKARCTVDDCTCPKKALEAR